MREIKFRAWDKSKQMWERNFSISNNGSFLRLGIGQKSEFWEVMQYTGLKDKNGKEIYEGDVVTYHCGSDKQTEPMVVAIPDVYISSNDSDGYMRTHSYEVIGNIYENPELVTK
jgi:hypothetical protein